MEADVAVPKHRADAAGKRMERIETRLDTVIERLVRIVNLTFERVPLCGCDPGHGPAPTRLQRLECAVRGGNCRPLPRTIDIPNE